MKVVITGTSRGIGLALAHRVVAAGHQLLAVVRRPEQSLALLQLAAQHPDRIRLQEDGLDDFAGAPGQRRVLRCEGNAPPLVSAC